MIKRIRKVEKGELLNFLYNLNINDKNLYDEVVKEQAIGIFQFTAGAAKIVVNEIQPSNFNELTAANAFARPGTLEYVPQYINNRDTKTRNYSKKISDLLEETYGVCLYQEQIMSIFNKVGLFSLEETNKVRSLMKKLGKKEKKQKDIDDWKNTVEKFAKGAAKNEINDKEVAKLTENLVSMSEYTFNKSHAVSYTYIALMTLYLSVYFRKYFYASVLTYESDREKYLKARVNSIRNQGIQVLPPNINTSGKFVKPVGNDLIYGLATVKFVTESSAEEIINNRPYTSIYNFIEKNIIMVKGRSKFNSRTIESLISVGAFDIFGNGSNDRKRFVNVINTFFSKKKTKNKLIMEGIKMWDDSMNSVFYSTGDVEVKDLVEMEKNFLGVNLFTSLFTKDISDRIDVLCNNPTYIKDFSQISETSKRIVVFIDEIKTLKDKNGHNMAFVIVSDIKDNTKKIPVFWKFWKILKDKISIYEDEKKPVSLLLYRKDENSIFLGPNGMYIDYPSDDKTYNDICPHLVITFGEINNGIDAVIKRIEKVNEIKKDYMPDLKEKKDAMKLIINEADKNKKIILNTVRSVI